MPILFGHLEHAFQGFQMQLCHVQRHFPVLRILRCPGLILMDAFDLEDALGRQENHMCSADLRTFIKENHLDLNQGGRFNPRDIFGSHTDMDHIYNTPRAWFMVSFLACSSVISFLCISPVEVYLASNMIALPPFKVPRKSGCAFFSK